MKKIIIGLVAVLVLGGAGGGLYFSGYLDAYLGEEEVSEEEEVAVEVLPELYLPLEPPFVVNFSHRGTLRYLQVSLELMYGKQETIDKVNQKMPAIRNALILLFSNQDYETLSTMEGKQELRKAILLAINDVIDVKNTGSKQSGEVYITNFVMQ